MNFLIKISDFAAKFRYLIVWLQDKAAMEEAVEDRCEGLGEEECLMRRTLEAHLDYIYTQRHKQP